MPDRSGESTRADARPGAERGSARPTAVAPVAGAAGPPVAGAAGAAGLPVVGAAGAAFCLALIFLALQMRAGDDPALGAGAGTAAAPARPVIVRRVVVRRIVEEAPAAPAASGDAGSAPAAAAAPAPAPAAAAPAPAPAPPPAPVTTQAS
jgi:pyruvate dehydrogenase E2 component (dihydrolipoamide acetyltransferase)